MSSKPTDDRRKEPGKSGARAAVPALDHIPAVSVEELLSTLSLALDLAEGRPKGHALRVSFISAAIAGAMDLGTAQRIAALNHGLAALLAGFAEDDRHPMKDAAVLRTTAAFADIVDAPNSFKRGHSRRVAVQGRGLAAAMGLVEGHVRAVELAGLLHDIGILRVPNHIISKPEILTVDAMHLQRKHPAE